MPATRNSSRRPTRNRKSWKHLSPAVKSSILRASATPSELLLLRHLTRDARTAGRFEFQSELCGYYPDFLFRSSKLIIELDGAVHVGRAAQSADRRRTRCLVAAGYRVVRFWNSELRDVGAVVDRIVRHLGVMPQIQF